MSVVGIITALRMEASCVSSFRMPYNRIVRLAEGSVVWLSGMGDDAARSAATELLELGVTSLVSFGIAGALDPKLSSGDLILPESILAGKIPQDDEDGLFSYPVSLEWRDRVEALLPPHLTIVGGTLTTSPGVLASAKAKLELGAVTGACAYDMESAAIAEVAAKYEAPFIAIRAITNPVDFSPPAELLHAIQPEGSIKILHLLSLLYQGSVDVATLLHLGKEIREARRTLATVIRKADKELGEMPRTVTVT